MCTKKLLTFDVVYPDDWTIADSGVTQFPFDLVVVNTTDDILLSTSTLQITGVTCSAPGNPTTMVTMASNATTIIMPHMAGGLVEPTGDQVIFGSGLVTEQRTDTNLSYVTFDVSNSFVCGCDVTCDATMSLEMVEFTAHFVIHHKVVTMPPAIFVSHAVRTSLSRPAS